MIVDLRDKTIHRSNALIYFFNNNSGAMRITKRGIEKKNRKKLSIQTTFVHKSISQKPSNVPGECTSLTANTEGRCF